MRLLEVSKNLAKLPALTTVFRVIILQVLFVLIAAFAFLGFSKVIFMSVLLGGFAGVLPNAIFALMFFSRMHKKQPQQIMAGFYINSGLKIALSVSAMIFSILCLNVNILYLFGGFLVASIAMWFSPIVVNRSMRAAS